MHRAVITMKVMMSRYTIPKSHMGLPFLILLFLSSPGMTQGEMTYEQFIQDRETISAVARLISTQIPAGGAANVERFLRDLSTNLEELRSASAEQSKTPVTQEFLHEHFHDCAEAVRRFAKTVRNLPGLVQVLPGQEKPVSFTCTQGRNLFVLWIEGDETVVPSLERILVHAESTPELQGSLPGKGHQIIFLEFAELPLGTHHYHLTTPGTLKISQPIQIQVTEPNQYRVKVVLKEDGEPVPCMISLVSLSEHTYRIPQEALDFDGHFDDGPRTRQLISVGAPYWKELTACCVEGVATYEIFKGRWRLTVAKGIEYKPWIEEFEVVEPKDMEKTIVLQRWVNASELGWYSGDGHVHTFQQNNEQRKRILTWAQATDIHVINTMKMGDSKNTYFENEGFGKAFRYQEGDTVLVPGQECPRTGEIGHTQALNLSTAMVRDTDQYYLYDFMFDGAHAQGALTGYCHVGWQGFHVDRDMSLNVPRGKVDFFEVLQFSSLKPDLWYDFLNLGYKVTALAGSDMPWGGSIGEVRVYAWLGKEGFDPDRWFESVRQGHTFVSNGPMLQFTVDQAIPGDDLKLAEPTKVTVHAKTWGDPSVGLPKVLEVVAHGEVVRAITAESELNSSLELSFDFPVDQGLWMAARTVARNGAIAHTTPIYIQVDEKGFVKTKDLEALLAKRQKSLAEIEELVASEKIKNPTGAISRVGGKLLERVGIARDIYEALQK